MSQDQVQGSSDFLDVVMDTTSPTPIEKSEQAGHHGKNGSDTGEQECFALNYVKQCWGPNPQAKVGEGSNVINSPNTNRDLSEESTDQVETTEPTSTRQLNQCHGVKFIWSIFFLNWICENIGHPFPPYDLVTNVLKRDFAQCGRKRLKRKEVEKSLCFHRHRILWEWYLQTYAGCNLGTMLEITWAVWFESKSQQFAMTVPWSPGPKTLKDVSRKLRCDNAEETPYTLKDMFPNAKESYLRSMYIDMLFVINGNMDAIARRLKYYEEFAVYNSYLVRQFFVSGCNGAEAKAGCKEESEWSEESLEYYTDESSEDEL